MMKQVSLWSGVALAVLSFAAPAARAQTPAAPPSSPSSAAPVIRWTSDDGKWEVRLRGRAHFDAYAVDADYAQNGGDEDYSRALARRVRLGLDVKAPAGIRYRIELERSRGDYAWTDVYLQQTGEHHAVTFGNQKGVTTLDEKTSNGVILFQERGAFQTAFRTGERRIGLVYQRFDSRWTFDAGVFGDGINTIDSTGDQPWVYAVRGTWVPVADPEGAGTLHVGAMVRYRDHADDARFNPSARPAVSNYARTALNPRLGAASLSADTLYEIEAAWLRGPFGLHAEYALLDGDRPTGADVQFSGGFVDAFYQITGESRVLRRGEFRRMAPARPVSAGGPGLWQVGARFDTLTLTDGTGACGAAGGKVCGGVQSTVAGVLNWQPEEWIRLSGQIAHSEIRGGNGGTGAARRDGDADTLQVRAAFDF